MGVDAHPCGDLALCPEKGQPRRRGDPGVGGGAGGGASHVATIEAFALIHVSQELESRELAVWLDEVARQAQTEVWRKPTAQDSASRPSRRTCTAATSSSRCGYTPALRAATIAYRSPPRASFSWRHVSTSLMV